MWEAGPSYAERASRKSQRVFRKHEHVLWDINRASQSNSLGKFWIEQGSTDFFPEGFLGTLNTLKCMGSTRQGGTCHRSENGHSAAY